MPQPFKKSLLLELGEKAQTLQERLATNERVQGESFVSGSNIDPIESWCKSFSLGNREAFKRRLAWDGLDLGSARLHLLRSSWLHTPPSWTSWLPLVAEEAQRILREQQVPVKEPSSEEFPFIELWLPFQKAASVKLESISSELQNVAPAIRAVLDKQLVKELSSYGALAALQDFQHFHATAGNLSDSDNSSFAYQCFVSENLKDGLVCFASKFPVLARQLAQVADTWVKTTANLFHRLFLDRSELESTFGGSFAVSEIETIVPALSDRHQGGGTVVRLIFRSGVSIIYKPRTVQLEYTYNQFLVWLSEQGLDVAPKNLTVIDREDYGWIEYVRSEPLEETTDLVTYFRKSGAVIAVAFVLRGRDLHMENLIASRDGPVLVDMEMIFQPDTQSDSSSLEAAALLDDAPVFLDTSCLASGVLTWIDNDGEGHPKDIGGLMGRGGFKTPFPRRSWKDLQLDTIHFVAEDAFVPVHPNQVECSGERYSPEKYIKDVKYGFVQTCQLLIRKRKELLSLDGPLSEFAKCSTRIVFRPSTQYGALQYVLAQPRYQTDGLRRSFAIETLNRIFQTEKDRPLLWPLIREEQRQIEELDIPRFLIKTDQTEVLSDDGEQVKGIYRWSGFKLVCERLSQLSVNQIEIQTRLLQMALSSTVNSKFSMKPPLVANGVNDSTGNDLMNVASWVGQELLSRNEFYGERALGRSNTVKTIAPFSLYEGSVGPALFFSALYSCTQNVVWKKAAVRALAPLEEQVAKDEGSSFAGVPLGLCDGLGGLILSCKRVSDFLGDETYRNLSVALCNIVTPEAIDSDKNFDVTTGVAGLIPALLELSDNTGESRFADLAQRAGEQLLLLGVEQGQDSLAWPVHGRFMAGFAHGSAGIAYALSRLYMWKKNPLFLEGVQKAYQYERQLFSTVKGNWPVVSSTSLSRPKTSFRNAWCHGAPGVGISRALALDAVNDEKTRGEIFVAMKTTLNAVEAPADHLCCGNMSRVEALLTIGRFFKNENCCMRSKELAVSIAKRAIKRHHFELPASRFNYEIYLPGFFEGLSGIGYQLLRVAKPECFPSIFESVQRSKERC